MANANIKISQLPNIGSNLNSNTILPTVSTNGAFITDKVTLGTLANFVLTEAGNTLANAFVSDIAFSVANAAQPNITSVGNLTGLTVTNLANLHIPGGTNGYVLQTNGNGNLNWTALAGSGNGNPGGANSQIQFNNGGLFDGDATLTFDSANVTLNTVNIATSDITVYGNTNTVNVAATGNITSNNVSANNISANALTSTGNISAPFFIGNGSALTGITATASGAGPNNSIQYNANGIFAGDANLSWDSANATLTTVSVIANGLTGNLTGTTVNANTVTANYLVGDGSNISNVGNANYANSADTANTAGTAGSVAVGNVVGIGNIATLSLDGNSSNVLYGNGVFAVVPNTANANYANFAGEAYSVSGANVVGEVANANYAVNVDVESTTNNYSYHVVLMQNPGGTQLQIDGDDQLQYNPNTGILTTNRLDSQFLIVNDSVVSDLVPFDSLPLTLGNSTNPWNELHVASNLVISAGPGGGSSILQHDQPLQVVGEGANSAVVMGWAVDQNTPDSIAVIGMNTPYSNGAANLLLAVGNNATIVNYWNFANDGTTTFPTLTVDLHNGGNQAAQTLQFGDKSQQAIITGPTPDVNNNAQRLIIQGQRGNGTGEGGDVYLWGGDADTNGGDIKIYAGDADNVSSGSGGYVNIEGGSGFDFGGYVSIQGGQASNGQGAPASVIGGYGLSGGFANIVGGQGYGGPGGAVNITGGVSGNGLAEYGNVNISAGASIWTFDNTGNLSLPGALIGDTPNNDGYLQWVGNSSGDSNGYTTLNLVPDNTLTGGDQYIILDPTAPGHIHIRAGGIQDNSFASLFLGGEQSYFMVPSGSSPSVYANAGGNLYTFGNDGVLSIPGNISFNGDPSAAPSLNDFFSVKSAVDFDIVTDSGNTTKTWTFDSAGNLTLPGNTFAVNYANNAPVNPVTKVTGTWTVTAGSGTYSFTVDNNATYQLWVKGNIPNGIIIWNATVTISNSNVPVVGVQYAWNYVAGGNILLTSIPNQIVGASGSISTDSPVVNNTNTFTFGITNNSGTSQTVEYGWTKIS